MAKNVNEIAEDNMSVEDAKDVLHFFGWCPKHGIEMRGDYYNQKYCLYCTRETEDKKKKLLKAALKVLGFKPNV